MSDYRRGDDRGPSAAELAFAFLLTAFLIWVIYEVLRWLFGTPEGQRALAVLLPVGAVVGIVALIIHAITPTLSSQDAARPSVAQYRVQSQHPSSNWDMPPGASGACYRSGALTECAWLTTRLKRTIMISIIKSSGLFTSYTTAVIFHFVHY